MDLSDQLDLVHDLHDRARSQGHYFQTVAADRIRGRTLPIDGRDVTWFGSCSYLGLEYHPKLIQGAIDATERYGTQFASSRGYWSAPLYEELEASVDQIFGAPSVVMPLTTVAHLAALPSLATERDAIVMDHQFHATGQWAARFAQTRGTAVHVLRHDNLEAGFDLLERLSRKHRQVWFATDGIFSMFGDLAPTQLLKDFLAINDNIYLYVDDAHGMSWDGKYGRGNFLNRMPMHDRLVLATTFAKAFAAGGAALVFPNKQMLDRVRLTAGPMVFSGPLQPPMQGAALASARLHLSDELIPIQRALATNVALFNDLCVEAGLPLIVVNASPIFFLRVGHHDAAQEIARRLLEDGYSVNVSMFPSVPQRRAGLRVAMTAIHTEAQIRGLTASLARHLHAVLGEARLSTAELDTLFAGAVPEAGSGTLMQGQQQASTFLREVEAEQEEARRRRAARQTLEVTLDDSIDDLDATAWDEVLGGAGCISSPALRGVEATFSRADVPPDEDWTVRYLTVRDRQTGKVVARTCATVALQKDDMFLHARTSEAIEEKRRADPYLLSSRFVALGTFLSEGDHLWLDRTGPWEAAVERLFETLLDLQHQSDARVLVLRDLAADDEELGAVLSRLGLVPMPIPTSWEITLNGGTVEEYVAGLSRRSRRLYERILGFRPLYTVKHWGENTGERLGDVDLAHLYALYRNIADRSHRINGFALPPRLLADLQHNPAWDLVTLHHRDGPRDGEAVAWYARHRYGKHDAPLMCGVDPSFQNREDSAYRQLFVTVVDDALRAGQRYVHLGMDADVEKSRIGASPQTRVAWVHARESNTDHLIEQLIAEQNAAAAEGAEAATGAKGDLTQVG